MASLSFLVQYVVSKVKSLPWSGAREMSSTRGLTQALEQARKSC
jgi:hypothetical protein